MVTNQFPWLITHSGGLRKRSCQGLACPVRGKLKKANGRRHSTSDPTTLAPLKGTQRSQEDSWRIAETSGASLASRDPRPRRGPLWNFTRGPVPRASSLKGSTLWYYYALCVVYCIIMIIVVLLLCYHYVHHLHHVHHVHHAHHIHHV